MHRVPVWLATLQLKNDPTDFSEITFIAFEHCIYSHACRNLDYYLINVHFAALFDGLRATSSSDSFFSRTCDKNFTLVIHAVYCVSVLLSRLIGIKVFPLNPYFCLKCLKHTMIDTLGCLIQGDQFLDFSSIPHTLLRPSLTPPVH